MENDENEEEADKKFTCGCGKYSTVNKSNFNRHLKTCKENQASVENVSNLNRNVRNDIPEADDN